MTLADDWMAIKDGELFVVGGPTGDIRRDAPSDGLYFRDMRYLSRWELSIDDWSLELLNDASDTIRSQSIYLTNTTGGTHFEAVARSLVVHRERTLDGALLERVSLTNHGRDVLTLTVRLRASSDFRDGFDIRGFATPDEEPIVHARMTDDSATFERTTPDGVCYRTTLTATPDPDVVTTVSLSDRDAEIAFGHTIRLEPGASQSITYRALPEVVDATRDVAGPQWLVDTRFGDEQTTAMILTSNDLFNSILARSVDDLAGLTTPLPGGGTFIAAGLPWYIAPFGRDSLIVGRQLLPFNPDVLANTLRFLATTQGTRDDPARDEQPGKIVHEVRYGDLSRRGIVPFSRYYGTVDATPLFLWMLAEYLDWTADDALFDELRPNVERALAWIATDGDSDRDGFVDYERRAEGGLQHQGWKDSHDALEHLDGAPVASPIALVEVQGYVYAAKVGLARHYERRGEREQAAALRREADQLHEAINQRFWMPEQAYYAEALDGDGRQLTGIASNAAHLLACDVASERQAAAVVARLRQPDMFSGWGIRTLSSSMPHYNPVTYHRGSVWPHDNGFGLWGLRRAFAIESLDHLATALFDAASRVRQHRIPELISGFPRTGQAHEQPVTSPIACSPQAWAAALPFVMLETLLGLQADAARQTMFIAPHLPVWLDWVEIRGLRVAGGLVDLRIDRRGERISVETLANPAAINIIAATG